MYICMRQQSPWGSQIWRSRAPNKIAHYHINRCGRSIHRTKNYGKNTDLMACDERTKRKKYKTTKKRRKKMARAVPSMVRMLLVNLASKQPIQLGHPRSLSKAVIMQKSRNSYITTVHTKIRLNFSFMLVENGWGGGGSFHNIMWPVVYDFAHRKRFFSFFFCISHHFSSFSPVCTFSPF